MTIHITTASKQDAADLARLVILGNTDDAMFNLIVPQERNATPAQKAEHLRWRTERNIFNMPRAGTYWFKAVDTLSNTTVGLAGVAAPQNEPSAWNGDVSETVDEKQFEEFKKITTEKKKELLGERKDFWHVPAMIVHPEYQGRGIGRRLLGEICNLADEAAQDIYLEASPVGTKLYLNAGFEKIGEMSLLDGSYILTCMLRKAEST